MPTTSDLLAEFDACLTVHKLTRAESRRLLSAVVRVRALCDGAESFTVKSGGVSSVLSVVDVADVRAVVSAALGTEDESGG